MGDILVWVLIFLMSLVVGLYLCVIYWQRTTSVELKTIFSDLRKLRSEETQARRSASAFEPTDPEPFGPLAVQLGNRLDQVESRTSELLKRYSLIQEQVRKLSTPTWSFFYRLPWDWYQTANQVLELKKDVEKTDQTLKATDGLVMELTRLGWKVAGQARQALEDDLAAERILADLRAANLRDPALEVAEAEVKRWETALRGEVPAYFIGADENTVLKDADKHTIAQVYRIVSEANPAIQEQLKRARGWQRLHEALAKSLETLPETFRQLTGAIAAAEAAPVHPVNWDASRGPLSGIRQQIERLGDIQKTRTLEQLESERQTAEKLTDRVKTMIAHIEEVARLQGELVALLATPEIADGNEWLRNAQKLANQVQGYSSDNWPRPQSAQTLTDELKSMADLQQRLSWETASVPIPETDIPNLLEDARRLSKLHQELRPRLATIQSRLNEMQTAEAKAKDALARTRALLNQAIPLLGSNPVLSGGPAREAGALRQEVEPLLADLEHPSEGLLDRKVQKTDLYLRKTDQAANKWLDLLQADLTARKQALAEKTERLKGIALLEDPAFLEAARLSEGVARPAVPRPASRVSSSPLSNTAPQVQQTFARITRSILPSRDSEVEKKPDLLETSARREYYSLADAIAEIKSRSEEWQRCIASLHAVEDLEGPVLERHEKASSARDSARQVLSRAGELMPEGRGWPPTAQALGGERKSLQDLEARWDAMKQEPVKALQLVNNLGALGEEYTAIGARIRQVVERAQQDQTRILDLEDRFEESRRLWMDQWETCAGNLVAQDEIKVLLEQADQDYSSIRERYLRSSIPYNQVLQNLRILCQRLDDAQITLDTEWMIDINGDRFPRYEQEA